MGSLLGMGGIVRGIRSYLNFAGEQVLHEAEFLLTQFCQVVLHCKYAGICGFEFFGNRLLLGQLDWACDFESFEVGQANGQDGAAHGRWGARHG